MLVILNPYAARGVSGKLWPRYEAELSRQGVAFELAVSKYPGHARLLAAEAAREGKGPIIAAGGDGTISEVINGIASYRDPEQGPMGLVGIIPLGSSNDLAKSLGIPLDPMGAAGTIARGRSTLIDLGKVNNQYFILNAAAGIEAEISLIQTGMQWISGPLRYQVAALRGLLRARQWEAHITWDKGSYQGPVVLVTVGNAPRTGGFYMTPHADLKDGLLTFVYALPKNRLELLATMRRALKRPGEGNYVELPGIFEVHSRWLELEIFPATPAHADGEIFSNALNRLHYSILPDRVEILV